MDACAYRDSVCGVHERYTSLVCSQTSLEELPILETGKRPNSKRIAMEHSSGSDGVFPASPCSEDSRSRRQGYMNRNQPVTRLELIDAIAKHVISDASASSLFSITPRGLNFSGG